MELPLLSETCTTGRELVNQQEFIKVEIYRQGLWQELPFSFLCVGDRFRAINGKSAGIVLKCVADAVEHKRDVWSVSAKPELS